MIIKIPLQDCRIIICFQTVLEILRADRETRYRIEYIRSTYTVEPLFLTNLTVIWRKKNCWIATSGKRNTTYFTEDSFLPYENMHANIITHKYNIANQNHNVRNNNKYCAVINNINNGLLVRHVHYVAYPYRITRYTVLQPYIPFNKLKIYRRL